MAKQKPSRRLWWQLDVLVLLMIGLLFLAHRLAPSPGWRTFLEVGVVIVGYGLMMGWLEAHSKALLDRPEAEANSSAVEAPELEMTASLSPQVKYHFYVGSDPAIIYDGSEGPTGNLRLNGHHLAKTTPFSAEEEKNS